MSIDLEKIERLHKAATPGPWKDKSFKRNYDWGVICSGGKRIAQCTSADVTDERKRVTFEEKLANAAYIAAACNAAPELVAENRVLRKRVRELEETVIMLQIENDTINELREAHWKQWEEQVRELERQAQVLAVAVSEYQRCKTCIVRRGCPNDAKGGPQEDCVVAILKWAEKAAKEAGNG